LEDARVELKQAWIPAEQAARRIAGHLNASRGDKVLWLVGVAESGRILSVDRENFAPWWQQVTSNFSGPIPRATDVVVYYDSEQFVALLFEGTQPPYLVRNPRYNTPQGGPVELEVPWREMTSIRTARHADLLRLLEPRLGLPELEIMSAELQVRGLYNPISGVPTPVEPESPCNWQLDALLYVVPRTERQVVLPAHRTKIVLLRADGHPVVELSAVTRTRNDPLLLSGEVDQLIDGPCRVRLHGIARTERFEELEVADYIVEIRTQPAGLRQSVLVSLRFKMWGVSQFEYQGGDVAWTDF